MHRKPNGPRMAGILIAAAFLVFGVLLAAFLSTTRGNTRDAIVLPDVAVQPQPPPDAPPSEKLFLQVGCENVQEILKTLVRPEAYHQSLQLTTAWSGGSAAKEVEIWRSGNLQRAQITQAGRKRFVLTDGEFAWIWYDAERTAAKVQLDQTRTLEDLIGVAAYETTIALDPAELAEADFVTLESPSADCLYLKTAADAQGYTQQYWIDVSTQLLCKASCAQAGSPIYTLLQTAFEPLTPGDAALQSLFLLPDGKALTAK